MSCKIWVWDGNLMKAAVGHVALEVYDGTPSGTYYISWWPGDGKPPNLSEKNKKDLFLNCEPVRSRKFSEDIMDEFGVHPTHNVLLAGLDDAAMKKFWDELTADYRARWTSLGTNCAACVVAALRAGGSDQYVDTTSWAFSMNNFWNTIWYSWTPQKAYEYSVRVQQKLREAGRMP